MAAGLSQIGEFSFILGQAGVSLGILNSDQYSLILAGALASITINPLLFRLIDPMEKFLNHFPTGRKLLTRHPTVSVPMETSLENHVVIIGCGRVGGHLAAVLRELAIPLLIVESDAGQVDELERKGIPSLYGDAANSEVLTHTELNRARALVITPQDEAAGQMIVASARLVAPELPIITRAETESGARQLTLLGAGYVIQTELEGGLEIVRYTLLQLGFP